MGTDTALSPAPVGFAAGPPPRHPEAIERGTDDHSRLRHRGALVTEARVVGVLALAAYVAMAAVLVFHHRVIMRDSLARVANASYVLYGRDPHLGAIGFVWGPVPSLAMLVLLPFSRAWTALVRVGFAANIVSAVFMAGAVVELRGCLADARVSRSTRLVITGAFALHPMIALYAADGMSEAPFLFFCLWAVRNLARWVRDEDLGALVGAGVALALAYLTRYEGATAIAGAMAVVALVSCDRARRCGARRRSSVLAHMVVVGLPGVAAIALFAAASWALVGHPFEQLASPYGNTAQVRAQAPVIKAVTGGSAESALYFFGRQTLALEPLAVLAVLAGGFVAVRRRDRAFVAPLAIFVPVLAFQAAAVITGQTFGWLRFAIAIVPLACLAAGGTQPLHGRLREQPRRRWLVGIAAWALVAATMTSGLASAAASLRDPRLGPEESVALAALGRPDRPAGEWTRHRYDDEWHLAAYLDNLRLPPGSVLVDVALGFPIVLASEHRNQFVITPDRDFAQIVADPALNRVRFLAVPATGGLGDSDALNRAYPGLFADGAGLATLVGTWADTPGSLRWRLYAVKRASTP